MARKQKDSMTTEELAKKLLQDVKEMSPEEEAGVRAEIQKQFGKPKQANLASLAGRAEHIRGLTEAAILIRSEEANFKEVMDYFEKLKTENAKFVN
jgi:hypothetical protein